jgi:S1-C subfamily serine protease/tetratricopeptide (TPR) repeat protein
MPKSERATTIRSWLSLGEEDNAMQCVRQLLVAAVAAGVILCSFTVGLTQEQDTRKRFGTSSLEAAKQIGRAIQLSGEKKHKEALAAIDAAIKEDGRSQMAYYWKGIILGHLGEVPDSIEAYKKSLSNDVTRSANITASAAINLGLLFGKLNELDESNVYFTRAIMADFNNTSGFRGQAYRHLAVNTERRGQFLASSVALTFAFKDKAKDVNREQITRLFEKAQVQEVARILYFPETTPKLEKRQPETKLSPVKTDGEIPDEINELWPDPQGRYLLAIPRNSPGYYLISTTAKVSVRKIQVDAAILGTCLVGGQLYAVLNPPARIEVMNPETGKVVSTYPLKGPAPTSLAVFPASSRVFFPGDGFVQDLNLKSGALTKTMVPADVVAGDPNQRFVYSYVKYDRTQWLPCSIVKSVVVPNGLLVAELRDNAAANGGRMSISPNGDWIAVAGGGGWRPSGNQPDSGYGVAVFSARNMEHLQGFFATDAYPRGVCFNPVTGQVASIREQDATVYHMADPKAPSQLKGPFSGAGAWSGDGRYLFLGGVGKGLSCWSNSLSDKETQLAGSWWKSIRIAKPETVPVRAVSFTVVTSVQNFQLAEPSRDEIAQSLAKAFSEGSVTKPPSWEEYQPYLKDDEMKQVVQRTRQSLGNKDDFGITIFQVRTALKTYPQCAPLKYTLAEAMRQGDQPDEAQRFYLEAIREDAGRTELSCLALNHLASLLASQEKGLSALHCLATSLRVDRANPQTLKLAQGLLKKHNLVKEAEQLTKFMADLPNVPSNRPANLPHLDKPAVLKKPTAALLYRTSVASVVLVRAGESSGSGVCIGSADTILTNDHVVAKNTTADVYLFAYKEKSLVRRPKLMAKVVFRSERDDLAVLKLDAISEDLRPLPVAEQSPEVGERVYTIGSPGLGDEVLEQSVSEGILSASKRVIEGVPYLQHTAAINPGNSGGPLIDEWGRLVGIVTLKAKLDNVGFAVPVETVRAVFKSQ